ncbi:hypothetical protein [Streptomyces aureus]|uniref:Secreted protein n=1 Tax=Streptomyces aureus TaxID=193461 RepID=A0ABV4SI76_9ACTN
MTPRLRTTGRPLPLPPLLWPLLFLALLSGAATTYAYAAEPSPSPTRAPASADDEAPAGSRPGEGRTPPGRAESKPPDRDRPKETPPTQRPRRKPSAAAPSAPDTEKPSASASLRLPSASHAHPKVSSAVSSADPSRKVHSARKSHSASASAASDPPKRSRAPSADPSRTRSAQAAIPVSPEEPQAWEEDPDEQQVQPSVRPTDVPVDNVGRTPPQTVAEPVIPGVGILPLGSGLVLVGLGVGFLALRLRRT